MDYAPENLGDFIKENPQLPIAAGLLGLRNLRQRAAASNSKLDAIGDQLRQQTSAIKAALRDLSYQAASERNNSSQLHERKLQLALLRTQLPDVLSKPASFSRYLSLLELRTLWEKGVLAPQNFSELSDMETAASTAKTLHDAFLAADTDYGAHFDALCDLESSDPQSLVAKLQSLELSAEEWNSFKSRNNALEADTPVDFYLAGSGPDVVGVRGLIRKFVVGLGMSDAKALASLSESKPTPLKQNIARAEGEKWLREFEALGAKVELRQVAKLN